jgi:hypothetical protein
MTKLARVVRDNNGLYHSPPEPLTVLSIVNRSLFDDRVVLNVSFQNGSRGAVFHDEVVGDEV